MDSLGRKMTLRTILCLILTASTTRAEPPVLSNQYGAPNNFGGSGGGYPQSGLTNSYGAPINDYGGGGGGHHGGHDEHQDYVDSQPKSYEFGYAVKDAASGNDFGRRETSDGETVRGEYRVQLPDGRTQIVTYTADWRTGFHADVRYEGVAQYPDQGYPAAVGSGSGNGGYDYAPPSNNIDSGYNGNQGGYNNYQGSGNNYNSPSYNYPFGSNSGDSGNGGGGGYGGSFGQSLTPPPQQSYGVPFH